jgi:hypothetical protein
VLLAWRDGSFSSVASVIKKFRSQCNSRMSPVLLGGSQECMGLIRTVSSYLSYRNYGRSEMFVLDHGYYVVILI